MNNAPITQSKWMEWARGLQAASQTGLHFTDNPYEIERYEKVRDIAAEMLAAATNFSAPEVMELNKADFGYATAKVDVRGAVFSDGGILLVREMMDAGRWTLPGGWADVNDTPSAAVRREVLEESGYHARPVKLAFVFDREKQGHPPPMPIHIYKLFFLCALEGGAAADSHETSGARFFPADALPELSVSRVTEAQIHRLFEHHRNPALATEFD